MTILCAISAYGDYVLYILIFWIKYELARNGLQKKSNCLIFLNFFLMFFLARSTKREYHDILTLQFHLKLELCGIFSYTLITNCGPTFKQSNDIIYDFICKNRGHIYKTYSSVLNNFSELGHFLYFLDQNTPFYRLQDGLMSLITLFASYFRKYLTNYVLF